MIPLTESERFLKFALVDTIAKPDPSLPPLIQRVVLVEMPSDNPVAYSPDEVVVEGKLAVDVIKG